MTSIKTQMEFLIRKTRILLVSKFLITQMLNRLVNPNVKVISVQLLGLAAISAAIISS